VKRHLGERLSALIDGELNDAQRERVLAHLAETSIEDLFEAFPELTMEDVRACVASAA